MTFHAQPVAIVPCDPASRSDLRNGVVSNRQASAQRMRLHLAGFEPRSSASGYPDLLTSTGRSHYRRVHGCTDELTELLHRLGYRVHLEGSGDHRRAHDTPLVAG